MLSIEQRQQFVGFTNKAAGWFTVAGGAFLIFLKEAWELAELYEAPLWLYIVVVVVLAIAAVSNTITRLSKSDEIIHIDDPEYRDKKRAERDAQQAEHRMQSGRPPRPQRTRKIHQPPTRKLSQPGRSNPGLQFSPLRAALRREAFLRLGMT